MTNRLAAGTAPAIDRATETLDFHKRYAALEGDREVILWHLLADVLEWCDARQPRISFDAVLEDVRQHLREDR